MHTNYFHTYLGSRIVCGHLSLSLSHSHSNFLSLILTPPHPPCPVVIVLLLQGGGGGGGGVGRDEPASVFQHRRVGALLEDLQAKFPYKYPTQTQQQQQQQQTPQGSQQGSQQGTQQEGTKLGVCVCLFTQFYLVVFYGRGATLVLSRLCISSYPIWS